MPRKNPPLIFVGGLSNRIYCATRYTKNKDGLITAHEKFDVTDQVGAALEELDRQGLELRPSPPHQPISNTHCVYCYEPLADCPGHKEP